MIATAPSILGLSVLIPLVIGTVIPALTSLIAREHATARLKALLTALLAAVGGTLSAYVVNPPSSTAQWEQVLSSILIAWIAAGTSYLSGWKPTGAAAVIARSTSNFGLGKHGAHSWQSEREAAHARLIAAAFHEVPPGAPLKVPEAPLE